MSNFNIQEANAFLLLPTPMALYKTGVWWIDLSGLSNNPPGSFKGWRSTQTCI